MSMRPCGAGPVRGWSPVRHNTLRMPSAVAPRMVLCAPMRVRSRAAICITGSTPCWTAMAEQTSDDMRGVAEGLSVKFTASTCGLSISGRHHELAGRQLALQI